MSRDVLATVRNLLALAASEDNDHEAGAAARKAARLIKEEDLTVGLADPKRERCIYCQTAHLGMGRCPRCGLACEGPGHPCTNPDPANLCRVHATWTRPEAVPAPRSAPFSPPFAAPFSSPFAAPYVNVGFASDFPYHHAYRSPPPGPEPSPPSVRDREVLNEVCSQRDKAQAALRRSQQSLSRARKKIEALERQIFEARRPELARSAGPVDRDELLLMPVDTFVTLVETQYVRAHTGLTSRIPSVEYVGDLVQLSEQDLLKTRYLGSKTVREIRQALMTLGLDLGTSVPDWPSLRERHRHQDHQDDAARTRST
jgi:hypothetical protein